MSTYPSPTEPSDHNDKVSRNVEGGTDVDMEVRFSSPLNAPYASNLNQQQPRLYNPAEHSYSFPMWVGVTPFHKAELMPGMRPPHPSVALPTTNALEGGGGTIALSELAGETYNHDPTNLLCCGLPLPITMTTISSTTGPRRKTVHTLQVVFTIVFDKLPRQLYLGAFLHLPALYATRVSRILEDAELTVHNVRKLYTPVSGHKVIEELAAEEAEKKKREEREREEPSLSVAHFKSTWESFVDSIMHEWKTLNIVSVLLLSAILTMLQIQGAGDDPVMRTAALLSLICGMYPVFFGGGKRTDLRWLVQESKKFNKSIWWNVWVLLAMPAVWLSWSLILFAVWILSFLWRTGSTPSPPSTGNFAVLPPRSALGVRIAITSVFFLGLVYLVLIVKTLRKYGGRMDQRWKQKVMEWVAEDMAVEQTLRPPVMVPPQPEPITSVLVPGSPSTTHSSAPSNRSMENNPLGINLIPLPQVKSPAAFRISDTTAADLTSVESDSDWDTHTTPFSSNAAIPVNEASKIHTREMSNSNRHTTVPLLDPPLAFFRPRDRLAPYTPLETMRITELSSLALEPLNMSYVFGDHNIYRDDWVTFMHDLSLVWGGRFPVGGLVSNSPLRERVHVAVDLVNNWNDKFFLMRKVEVVLCMEEPKKLSPNLVRFALYLTNPAKTVRSRGELSHPKLAPAMPWADCIPAHVRNVVPLTGQYALRGQLRGITVGHASVELFSTAPFEDSGVVDQHRRVNTM